MTIDQEMDAVRSQYVSSRWRVEMAGDAAGEPGLLRVQRRFGLRSGLSLLLYRDPQHLRRDGLDQGIVGLEWWREREPSPVPMLTGISFAVGPLFTMYTPPSRAEDDSVASGIGVGALVAVRVIIPALSYFSGRALSGWFPHVMIEYGIWGGLIGRMENETDFDVNADGILDRFKGDRFAGRNDKPPRNAWGSTVLAGFSWHF